MKDVLDYTEDELRSMSNDELKELQKEARMKESLFNIKQLVNKRLMNALYGALGNAAFPLFNEHMAAAITGNGRFFIQTLAKYFEEALQRIHPNKTPYLIYGDTDSIYYTIAPLMDKVYEAFPGKEIDFYVDKANEIEQKLLQPVIKKAVGDFCTKLNAYNPSVIWAEREIIADTAVFVAKKKYFARVRDSEGVRYPSDDPYIKVMGLELIKSSTPKWSQKKLKESIPIFLDSSEPDAKRWVNDSKTEFIKTDPADLASVSSVSNIDYNLKTDKGIPIGSRSALVFNNYIKEKDLVSRFEPIRAGDKTKRLFLTKNNPLNSNIVAFNNDEFISEIKDYIDYDETFFKTFLKPLEIMATALNWNLLNETDTEDW